MSSEKNEAIAIQAGGKVSGKRARIHSSSTGEGLAVGVIAPEQEYEEAEMAVSSTVRAGE